ncbi:MAG TPA: DUF1800 family protein [Blastocatellia bacterium]|nr:DUF1800 family protein [Blastocatellia bacterium]
MRSKIRPLLALALRLFLIVPMLSTAGNVLTNWGSRSAACAQQQPQGNTPPFEPLVNRLRETLALSDQQVTELRGMLVKHAPRLLELRNRAQATPYAPGLGAEVEKEQRAIRDELSKLLDEGQKGKLASVDTMQLVPIAPPFVAINIPPRSRIEAGASKVATAEPLMPAPVAPAKGRSGRLTEDQKILHLLNRISFGPRPGDLARIKQTTIERFIDEQLHPETIDDSDLEKRLAVLPTQRMTSAELYQFYPPLQVAEQRANEKNAPPIFGRPQQLIGELVQQKLVRAVSSNRQLQEVLTDFWFNHFNVFAQKEADQWFVTSYERDVIRPHVLGKFRDLLLATAQSPAMMYYLDNWLSSSPESRQPRPPMRPQNAQPPRPAPGASPRPPAGVTPAPGSDQGASMMTKKEGDQNSQPKMQGPQSAIPNPQPPPRPPARKPGINENYARELLELHTLGVDGGYTQKDVQEVARCFTGWTIDRPFQGGGFVFRPWMHDDGAKTVLGVTIPAGGGINDGLRVIDIISKHPSTARFISKKLCQRFVSDEPPPQLIERVAQVFLRTEGDVREVLRAIVSSSEFNSPAAFRSKVKSPLELAASAIRAVDGDTNGAPQIHDWVRRMGEPLYQFAFPTGYGETSEKWVNTGVFFNRINYAVALANNQIQGTGYDPMRLVPSELASNTDQLTSRLAALIVHTELSPESLRAVRASLNEPAPDTAALRPATNSAPPPQPVQARAEVNPERRRIARAVGLLMGTAEFQRK